MSSFQFSSDQREAGERVSIWLHNFEPYADLAVFRLFGYAGTGKTTIIQHLKDLKGLNIVYGAFTGKAAMVMRQNNIPARTIHSLLYIPKEPSRQKIDELRALVKGSNDKTEKSKLWAQIREAEKVTFVLNPDSLLVGADLCILDECSMIGQELMDDLLSFNVPYLYWGTLGNSLRSTIPQPSVHIGLKRC